MNDEQGEIVPDDIRASDLMEQIAQVNKLIDLRRGDEFMENQYIKSRFVGELREILLRDQVFVVDEPPIAA